MGAMSEGRDWHLFDEDQGLEVRRVADHQGGQWQVRRVGGERFITLTDQEWEMVREPGPDPVVLAALDG